MKRIILSLCLFIFIRTEAQQINPVPDYVFSNKMSVGRNAVTDTAAYFSIGPRYGAIRGMMPPMVTDTANMSATKRNGLLIFSIQKNKYLYWDSVGSKWAEMAGTAGSAITGSGVAGYMPEFTTSTNLDTTRLYHSAGRFAIGSTTTTNGVFNVYGGRAYFDTSVLVGSNTFFADEANGRVGIGTTTPQLKFVVSNAGAQGFEIRESSSSYSGGVDVISYNRNTSAFAPLNYGASQHTFSIGTTERMRLTNAGELLVLGTYNPFASSNRGNITLNGTSGNIIAFTDNTAATGYIFHAGVEMQIYNAANGNLRFFTNSIERFRLQNDGEMLIATTTDAGAYALQVAGSIYNTTGAVLAASSGNVGIGTTSATDKLRVIGTIRGDVTRSETYSQFQYWYPAFINMSTTNATPANYATTLNGTMYFRPFDVSQGAGLNSVGWSLGVHDSNNDYGYSWQMLSDFSGNIALRAASSSTTWKSPYMIWKDGGNVGIGTTSPSERLHVNGNILTAAPSGGTAKPFKIGAAATVSPTSPNRTIEIEIDGTTYYLHAKTTNN